eukprot:CAMPEP_0179184148 /NCGR_PEP_ID=MMETSP0796-20121207/91286_1 /TAXON_ID=73915 /ORGANISM="Pyrodinium bahamense, Strain pbaha01" /LENGTH=41 /DNA_ID= /DNA_START= /DNA_END= /DNA_ORIENTATION=
MPSAAFVAALNSVSEVSSGAELGRSWGSTPLVPALNPVHLI